MHQGFTALRALRAVAVALRVVRVLINLRRARKLSGHMAKKLRSTVSQNKRRYMKHGFDLDLTYITNRVIAMGTPAFGKHSSYRNDIHVVSRFMAFRHYGCFFIFNLCDTYTSSDGITGNYNADMLFNQVQRIPFEDHGPPLMSEMLQFCEEAQVLFPHTSSSSHPSDAVSSSRLSCVLLTPVLSPLPGVLSNPRHDW